MPGEPLGPQAGDWHHGHAVGPLVRRAAPFHRTVYPIPRDSAVSTGGISTFQPVRFCVFDLCDSEDDTCSALRQRCPRPAHTRSHVVPTSMRATVHVRASGSRSHLPGGGPVLRLLALVQGRRAHRGMSTSRQLAHQRRIAQVCSQRHTPGDGHCTLLIPGNRDDIIGFVVGHVVCRDLKCGCAPLRSDIGKTVVAGDYVA